MTEERGPSTKLFGEALLLQSALGVTERTRLQLRVRVITFHGRCNSGTTSYGYPSFYAKFDSYEPRTLYSSDPLHLGARLSKVETASSSVRRAGTSIEVLPGSRRG